MKSPTLAEKLGALTTEQGNPASRKFDKLSTESILRITNSEDKLVPIAVEAEIPYIARAVDLVVTSFRSGGRLIYVGAGTSGRLGILDASECPPTFGTDPSTVIAIIAGGRSAVFRSEEGAEDNESQAIEDIDAQGVGSKDVVCGIAASRLTPYVVASVKRAKNVGQRQCSLRPIHERALS